jgi:hypothetical protein
MPPSVPERRKEPKQQMFDSTTGELIGIFASGAIRSILGRGNAGHIEPMRATLLTLTVTAGLAFGTVFALANWHRQRQELGRKHAAMMLAAPTTLRNEDTTNTEDPTTASSSPAAGVLRDTVLREALASSDLADAVKSILAHDDDDHCTGTRLVCLVENLPVDRLSEVGGLLDGNSQNQFIVRFVLQAWAQRDPAAALSWVQAHPSLKQSGVHAFMLGWARATPEAALEWVENQPLGTAHSGLRTTVIEAMAERNPAAALELMRSRGWLGQHPRAMLKLLQNWGGTEPAAALEGLRGIVAEMKLNMDMRVSGPSESFRAMLGALLYGVFERNPREAKALLAQLTPQESATGQDAISSEILARDPEASEAIVSRPADPATRSLLRGLAEKNAEAAVSLLPRIEDKSLQVELLTAAAGSPYSENPLEIPEELRPTVMAALSAMTDAQARGRLLGRMCVDNAGTSPAWAAEIWGGLPLVSNCTRRTVFSRDSRNQTPLRLSLFFRQPDLRCRRTP